MRLFFQSEYVSRIAGTSTVVGTDACRAPAPPVPLDALTLNVTCIVSIAHVTRGCGVNSGQAAPGASDVNETVPEPACHIVTAPPAATWIKFAFTKPVPIDPETVDGAVDEAFCAKPLTSIRLPRCDGSSSAMSVHVDDELPVLENVR